MNMPDYIYSVRRKNKMNKESKLYYDCSIQAGYMQKHIGVKFYPLDKKDIKKTKPPYFVHPDSYEMFRLEVNDTVAAVDKFTGEQALYKIQENGDFLKMLRNGVQVNPDSKIYKSEDLQILRIVYKNDVSIFSPKTNGVK